MTSFVVWFFSLTLTSHIKVLKGNVCCTLKVTEKNSDFFGGFFKSQCIPRKKVKCFFEGKQ